MDFNEAVQKKLQDKYIGYGVNGSEVLQGANFTPLPTTAYETPCNQKAYQPPTLREEAEKLVGHHREQANKHDLAAAFFRENPAFDEFIRLIRSGAIRI